VILAVAAASVSAFVTLQPQVAANSAQGAASAASGARSGQTNITGSVTVDKGSVVTTVTATGNIVAAQESNLTFDTSGIVRKILVQEGQPVEAGQVLATVDDSNQQSAVQQAQLNLQAAQSALDKVLQPVDPNTIAVAEAEVKAAQGAFLAKETTTSAATIAVAQAKVKQAQADYDYAVKLQNDAGGKYATSDPNYQLALAQTGQAGFNLKNAQLNLQASHKSSPVGAAKANVAYVQAKLVQTQAGPLQSEVDQAQAAVVAAQIQLDQAKRELAKTILVAPFAGVITQINAKSGEPAQGTAIVIADLSSLYVDIRVDESDISEIAKGQKVDLTVDALPGVQITGSVDRVYPIADATASVITYPVHVVIDKTTQPIRAGMTANATFQVQAMTNVLRVPNNYLKVNRASGGGAAVITAPVRVGLTGADYTEIIDGLNPGDTIALVAQTPQQSQ
jgi:HlyD family secretion protein